MSDLSKIPFTATAVIEPIIPVMEALRYVPFPEERKMKMVKRLIIESLKHNREAFAEENKATPNLKNQISVSYIEKVKTNLEKQSNLVEIINYATNIVNKGKSIIQEGN